MHGPGAAHGFAIQLLDPRRLSSDQVATIRPNVSTHASLSNMWDESGTDLADSIYESCPVHKPANLKNQAVPPLQLTVLIDYHSRTAPYFTADLHSSLTCWNQLHTVLTSLSHPSLLLPSKASSPTHTTPAPSPPPPQTLHTRHTRQSSHLTPQGTEPLQTSRHQTAAGPPVTRPHPQT